MKRILVVVIVVALAAISCGSLGSPWSASDHLCNVQCLTTMVTHIIATDCPMPSGLFFFCAEDTATDETPTDEGKKDEKRKDEPVPGIDRTWNVVMYG